MEEYGLQNKAQEIAEKISGVETPVLGFVLGSGWGGVVEALQDCRRFAYKEIGLSECGVAGHAGNLVFGKLCNVPVVIQQGRFHLYEGREVFETVLPIAVMKELGVRSVVLTNAAGGLNPSFQVGDLMFLTDHINFSGKNPLTGLHPTDKYPVFVDMTKVYDAEMTNLLALAAERAGVRSQRGVYMQVPGPSFETPAEILAFQKLGADAVGMSTVCEAIFARYLHLRVAGMSCITNLGAGMEEKEIRHEDVLQQSLQREKKFCALLQEFAKIYS
ncbi:MAG TPA: purine-nucleoside phosphorylase [Candidatus Borkfalkia faecipullorum]|uniref:Purine nucleoside phosphorylase n=1 Tax=Candidatus Borkfalkia faecipullorum TaxID=2838510 RepID=A0A9D1V944_9FIRM|nr:purine-nucleoside phosphorylase [Candidatus Borkfalkia faecipullorum]